LFDALRQLVQRGPGEYIMPWFGQGVDAGDGVLSLKRRWWLVGAKQLHLQWDLTSSRPTLDALIAVHRRLSEATGGTAYVPPSYSVFHGLITPHPLGGCPMSDDAHTGVVDHAGQVFGYPGLYVADGAIIPRALGVNPSRTIAALAERIAELIVCEQAPEGIASRTKPSSR
jgi:cholesterol oxidase